MPCATRRWRWRPARSQYRMPGCAGHPGPGCRCAAAESSPKFRDIRSMIVITLILRLDLYVYDHVFGSALHRVIDERGVGIVVVE
eukprot:633940-Hanusia_phi.AAC.1